MKKADHTCPPNFKDRKDVSKRLAEALSLDVEAMFYRPWLVVLPGMFLFVLVIGANLMGDGLRDITSPEEKS